MLISTELPILYFKGSQVEILNYNAILSLRFGFVFANSADIDVIPQYVAFHLGFHGLPMYLFHSMQLSRMKRVKYLVKVIGLG